MAFPLVKSVKKDEGKKCRKWIFRDPFSRAEYAPCRDEEVAVQILSLWISFEYFPSFVSLSGLHQLTEEVKLVIFPFVVAFNFAPFFPDFLQRGLVDFTAAVTFEGRFWAV